MAMKKLNSISDLKDEFGHLEGERMPSLFLGHGSPMNAVQDNAFTRTLSKLGEGLSRPSAVLCISAHWMSEGTWITAMENPKTIHDFYGFPKELFEIDYPARGAPDIAEEIQGIVHDPKIQLDNEAWGLDHGTWSVLRHMYPKADVPVMQLSVYMAQPAEYHFKLGQELAKLREKGVLVLGSGNIVHNLREIKWEDNASPYDWAVEFDQWVKKRLNERDFDALQKDFLKSESGRLSVPSMDHYYPLLYILGTASGKDELKFEYEEMQNGSISMRCLSFGR